MKIDAIVFEGMRPMPVFRPELRKANRDGMKSQTRRVVDPQPISTTGFWKGLHWANEGHFRKGAVEHCPYGVAGDYCYMREPLMRGFGDVAYYCDDGVMVRHALTGEPITWRWKKDTLTSIFMPKEAGRFVYRYVDIRVERLQEITEADAKAEGVAAYTFAKGVLSSDPPDCYWKYIDLWDRINAERGYPWDSNPWVWVLGYTPSGFATSPILGEHQNGGGNAVEVRDGEN